jgi:hypothetical protein
MRLIYICFFLLIACSIKGPLSPSQDDFDKIIAIMKTKSTTDLFRYYGKPDEVSESKRNENIQILSYKDSRIDAYVDKFKKDRISHLTIFYFEDFDNYAALKKRFKDYKWTEEKLPNEKSGHVLTDLYLVKVPEINMEFQYDNYAPKRKVMWIYFD